MNMLMRCVVVQVSTQEVEQTLKDADLPGAFSVVY